MIKAFLIKYGEIAIKGKNRYVFENYLVQQIKIKLKKQGEFVTKKEQGRIFVEAVSDFDYEEVLKELKKVFGIVSICPVSVLDDFDFEAIKKLAINHIEQEYEEKNFTFKVYARRANKNYPLNSMEIAKEIGSLLLEEYKELKVDVKQPQEKIMVELRNKVYIYSKEVRGLGGMPIGSAGKAMLLLSGGIDSPVAGWMIAKRGVALDAVYYHSHPYTSERAKQKVIDLAKQLGEYTGRINLHVVPFTDIQLYIYETCPHEELTIIMRRVMMQMAETIAKNNKGLALVTGESLGQVASQTIQSLTTTNAVCQLPVFRPLIALDKQEIVNISEKIGTYETSILPYEDCCTIFVAKHPVTKPNLKSIEKSERKLEKIDVLIQESLDQTEVIKI
ncbi:thiamine biosynthesis protein ThiI [Natranaerovirga hydrolytica]|uniref:Probable tRNA sulfurtransferase n=1 Tax=Natranaerovirga hydrolytica TaxID=680378 RepID=A0A4R1N300_9FIRM|nr:tRNA uracil 4-sulfurtransferase ThiI [Natranaerovirga hydrolytica]TCK98394.1 thiamine biosynthesis protein ThiI [Natranaerovirga hydrolytica]